MRDKKRFRIELYVSEELRDKIQERAESIGLSLSSFIRYSLLKQLNDNITENGNNTKQQSQTR